MGTNSDPDAHPLALGWLIASIVAGAFVLVFLVLAVRGQPFVVPGLVAVIFLVWLAQQQFSETHRRRYHRWPQGRFLWSVAFFWTGSRERSEIAQAWRRRDPDRTVELSRVLGTGLLVLAGVAAFAFLAAGIPRS